MSIINYVDHLMEMFEYALYYATWNRVAYFLSICFLFSTMAQLLVENINFNLPTSVINNKSILIILKPIVTLFYTSCSAAYFPAKVTQRHSTT